MLESEIGVVMLSDLAPNMYKQCISIYQQEKEQACLLLTLLSSLLIHYTKLLSSPLHVCSIVDGTALINAISEYHSAHFCVEGLCNISPICQ